MLYTLQMHSVYLPLPSSGQYLSSADCLMVMIKDSLISHALPDLNGVLPLSLLFLSTWV